MCVCMYDAAHCNAMQHNAHAEGLSNAARIHACMHLNSHTLVQLINRISTDIDILCEQLVRHLVFFQDVVISPRAREGGTEEEAEHSAGGDHVSVSYGWKQATKRMFKWVEVWFDGCLVGGGGGVSRTLL